MGKLKYFLRIIRHPLLLLGFRRVGKSVNNNHFWVIFYIQFTKQLLMMP